MADKDIVDPDIQRGIIRVLINRLYKMLDDLAQEDSNVHVIDVRGTLPAIEDWNDEIHGTSKGFSRVSELFLKAINDQISPD